MANDMAEVVQRNFQFCVIDEVDSILIDEARTPLIISGQVERSQEKYEKAAYVAESLVRSVEVSKEGVDPEGDYEVDEKQRSCVLTDEGYRRAEKLLGVNDLYDPGDPWAHYITNALKAKELFIKDVNYINDCNSVYNFACPNPKDIYNSKGIKPYFIVINDKNVYNPYNTKCMKCDNNI